MKALHMILPTPTEQVKYGICVSAFRNESVILWQLRYLIPQYKNKNTFIDDEVYVALVKEFMFKE
ncbi:hypothetical protein G9A89_012552 [Geosiphon pyriformis]|nr:hypothetical protein G9A89_012552 [Geosiphon pyriformis]